MPITYNLILGTVTFLPTETPSLLEDFGGIQMLAKIDHPGGIRTVQCMGAFPHDLKWEGMFFEDVADFAAGTANIPVAPSISGAAQVFQRANQIDQMRVNGLPVTASYGPYVYTVIVQDFKIRPKQNNYVPYMISLLPVQWSSIQTSSSAPKIAPSIPR